MSVAEPGSEVSTFSNADIFNLICENKVIVLLLFLSGTALAISASMQDSPGGVLTGLAIGVLAFCAPFLAWIDHRTMRLPDFVTAPMAAAVAVLVGIDTVLGNLAVHDLLYGVVTGLGMGVLFLLIAIMMSGGLGMGDIKFVVIAGIILGIKSLPVALFSLVVLPPLLALLALLPLLVTYLLTRGPDKNSLSTLGKYKFAYGPYLVVGTLIGFFVPASAAFLTVG